MRDVLRNMKMSKDIDFIYFILDKLEGSWQMQT